MKRIGKKCVAIVLTIVLTITELLGGNIKCVQAVENKMPFTIENTDCGIIDRKVKGQKLILTNENAEVIHTNITNMLLIRENTSYGIVKVYVVGVQGVLHTYEVESDSEWLSDLYSESGLKRNIISLNANAFGDTYTRSLFEIEEYNSNARVYDRVYSLEDSMIKIRNPNTNKYDLVNLSTGKYYEYSCDSISVSRKNFLVYKIDNKVGILDKHGEKLTDASFSDYYAYKDVIKCEYENDEKSGEALVTLSGTYVGEEIYQRIWLYDGYAVALDETNQVYYINLETGDTTKISVELDMAYGIIANFDNSKQILVTNHWVDKEYDDVVDKAYLIKDDQVLDLNDSLGGSYCSIRTFENNHTNSSVIYSDNKSIEKSNYFYASAYNIVRNENGKYDLEYCYQGVVDENGEPVYGYDSPDYSNIQIGWFTGKYLIAYEGSGIADGGKSSFIKIMDTSGKEYYRTSADKSIDELSITDNYMSFHITKDDISVLINLKTGEVKEYQYDLILLNSQWQFKGNQYAWIDCGAYYKIENLDNGKSFSFCGIANSKYNSVEDFVVSKDEKHALIYMKDVETASDDFMSHGAILNENLELIYNDDVDYISLDLSFSDEGDIYDFNGNLILQNYTNFIDLIEHEDLIRVGKGENYNPKYSFCDYEGNLLYDYVFDSVSDFTNGLAFGYIEDEEKTVVINSNKEKILEGKISRYSDRDYEYMRGDCAIFQKGKEYYLYDFSGVERPLYSTEQAAYNEDEENEKNTLLRNAEKLQDFKFTGMDTTISLPEDIPVIGGEEISLDFSEIPIIIEKSGNTFRGGIGIIYESDDSSLFDLSATEWSVLKKSIEKNKKNLFKGKNLLLASQYGTVELPKSSDINAEVWGYFEGVVTDGGIESCDGIIKIEFTYSVGQKWQTFVASVPVVLSAKLEAGVSTEIRVGLDLEKCELKSTGEVEWTLPRVNLSAGVGVAYVADVSVYGELENKVLFSQGADTFDTRVRGYIDGEMGVSVSALMFNYKKTLWPGKKEVYFDSAKGVVTQEKTIADFQVSQEDLKIVNLPDTSEWETTKAKSSDMNPITVLQENAYAQANPQIIANADGLKMMVYTAYDSNREMGTQTILMYSIYNEESDTWSQPQCIEDDGTADFYPDILAYENSIYITWMDSNSREFAENVTLEEVAESCEIKVAKYDVEQNSFANVVTLTQNDYVDIRPSLSVFEEKVYVVWSTNLNNDLLNLSGINEIRYSILSGDEWINSDEVFVSEEQPIKNASIGVVGNDLNIVYIVDTDGNVNTTNDTKVYAGGLSGEAVNVLEFQSDVLNIEINKIYDMNVLVLSTKNGLYYTEDLQNTECLLDSMNLLSEYQIIHGDSDDMIIGCEATDEGNNIFAYKIEEGLVLNPIPITNQETYIQHPNGFYDDGNYYLTFTKTEFKIDDEEEMQTSTDICCMKFNNYADLCVESFEVENEEIIPGKSCTIKAIINNKGIQDINAYEVTLKIGNIVVGKEVVNEILVSGAEKEVDVDITFPNVIELSEEIICEVSLIDNGDINTSNNMMKKKLSAPNLQLNVFQNITDEGFFVNTYVKNDSGFGSAAILKIHDKDKNGEILYSIDVGEIKPNEVKKVIIPENIINEIINEGSTYYFEICPEQEDQYICDNYEFISISKILINDIYIEEDYIYMNYIGEQQQLEVSVEPYNATNKKLVFSSSNTSIATVTEKGLIEAKSEGDVDILIQTNDGSDIEKICHVNIKISDDEELDNSDGKKPVNNENGKGEQSGNNNVILPIKGTQRKLSSGIYLVTKSTFSQREVAFVKPRDRKKTKVTIPNTVLIDGKVFKVTEIVSKAFKNNSAISTIKIGKNVKLIGNDAFYNCKKLKKITLGGNVLAIGDRAFYKCVKLTSIMIPLKVKKIGKEAFYGDKNLKNITIKSSKLTSKSVGKNAFKGTNKKLTIKVPKKKVSSYKKFLKKKGNKKITVKK